MDNYFMNLDDGDIGVGFGDYGMNSKGEPLMKMGDNMVVNMKTGKMHFTYSWGNSTDDADNPSD